MENKNYKKCSLCDGTGKIKIFDMIIPCNNCLGKGIIKLNDLQVVIKEKFEDIDDIIKEIYVLFRERYKENEKGKIKWISSERILFWKLKEKIDTIKRYI